MTRFESNIPSLSIDSMKLTIGGGFHGIVTRPFHCRRHINRTWKRNAERVTHCHVFALYRAALIGGWQTPTWRGREIKRKSDGYINVLSLTDSRCSRASQEGFRGCWKFQAGLAAEQSRPVAQPLSVKAWKTSTNSRGWKPTSVCPMSIFLPGCPRLVSSLVYHAKLLFRSWHGAKEFFN